MTDDGDIPRIDLSDPEVARDPFTAYGRARERAPLARLIAPGLGPMWAVTRYTGARAMLADERFRLSPASFLQPQAPEDCRPYMRTMQEMEGPEHARLRRLVAAAFTPRRAESLRPRIERIAGALLDAVADQADGDHADLLTGFARPLPIEVICELIGIPGADRPAWREYGAAVAAGDGRRFAAALPAIIADARQAVARRRADPGDDLISGLLHAQDPGGDRLSDTEIVTLTWHLVLAGQTPANLIANGIEALLSHPGQLAALRADPGLLPGAVEELTRWCGPQLLSIPRYPGSDTELCGVTVRAGEPVTAVLAAANRDPRVLDRPDELDITRAAGAPGHLGYAHGPHFCLGAPLARTQVQVALAALLRSYPGLELADAGGQARRVPDPATWRLAALPVRLGQPCRASSRPLADRRSSSCPSQTGETKPTCG
jgi:cytochrome P450